MSHADSISAPISWGALPRYQPMVLCVLAMILGIVLDCWLDVDFSFCVATAAATGVAWLILIRRAKAGSAPQLESLTSILLLISLLFLSAGWHHGRWNWFGPHEIGSFASDDAIPCCVDAIAISEPRWLAPADGNDGLDYQSDVVRTRVTVRVDKIRHGEDWQTASGKLDLIIHCPTLHFRSGDKIRVFGKLSPIGAPTNPGQFDFRTFYRTAEKLATLHTYHPECVQVLQPAGWVNSHVLSMLRRKLDQLTWTYIDPDEAAFASAILLGNREQLSPDRQQLFLQTGTIHLLAISGLHVGILAGSFFLLFRMGWVSRRNCLYLTIAFVICYAWLVEFRPPVSRAAILIVLFCLSRILGERSFSYNLLSIAGMTVLVINPHDLFSLGAQLSFLAVGTLNFGKDWVFWPPPADPILRLIATTRPLHVRTIYWMGRNLRTAILVSGLIWWVAMPLVALRFHLVAPIALVVNPLLLIPIAWALYGGLGVMVSGWFLPPLAAICGKICEWNLALIESMIGFAQSLPYSHFWTAGPTVPATIVFYIGLFFGAVYPPTRMPFKWIAWLSFAWLLCGWIGPDRIVNHYPRQQTNPLICTFIDVGHGTSVLLQLPDGKNMLYDAGSFGSSNYGFRNVAGVLWDQRIEHLDAIVISHADTDHFNAVPELCRRFSIGEVILSPQMLANTSPAVRSVLSALQENRVDVRTVFTDSTKLASGSNSGSGPPVSLASSHTINHSSNPIHKTISILSPPPLGTGGTDNSDSIVLLVEHANNKILLPGDLEAEGMRALLSTSALDTNLVMAAHHGSINSDPTEFMQWSTPEVVVISGGNHRIKDAVVRIFQQQNRAVFRTDRQGAIRYTVNNSGASIKHWAANGWVEFQLKNN